MYTALKPCKIGGNDFKIGEVISDDLINNAENLCKMGVIAKTSTESTEEMVSVVTDLKYMKIEIPIHSEEGTITIELTNEELVQATDVMQASLEDAKVIVSTMTSGDALIFLDVMDGRKGLKAVIKERANELFPEEEETPENAEPSEDVEKVQGDA